VQVAALLERLDVADDVGVSKVPQDRNLFTQAQGGAMDADSSSSSSVGNDDSDIAHRVAANLSQRRLLLVHAEAVHADDLHDNLQAPHRARTRPWLGTTRTTTTRSGIPTHSPAAGRPRSCTAGTLRRIRARSHARACSAPWIAMQQRLVSSSKSRETLLEQRAVSSGEGKNSKICIETPWVDFQHFNLL
jgi:hypothetical protein